MRRAPSVSTAAPLHRLERAEPTRDQAIHGHDDERNARERRGERDVVRDADGRIDDIADELRPWTPACEQWRDVVAEREREREDRARDHARQRERQHDSAEGLEPARAEIA